MIKLKLLTDDQDLIAVAEAYWNYDPNMKNFHHSVKDIGNFFGTKNSSVVVSKIAEICVAYEDTWICSLCKRPNFTFQNRADYLDQRRVREHHPSDEYLCRSCLADLEAQEIHRRRKILEKFRDRAYVVSMNDLSLMDAVFLTAYGRVGLSENQEVLLSLDYVRAQKSRISPIPDEELAFVRRLYQAYVIQIHSDNSTDIFSEIRADNDWSFSAMNTNWSFPRSIVNPDKPSSLFQELESAFIRSDWPDHWKTEVFSTWKKMALWECLEYLVFTLSEHKLELNPGEKTMDMFNRLLERYSVAQIYSFIWRAARDAAAFYMRGGVAKKHAANTVVGTIQRMADRAEAEAWNVSGYRRDFDLPQSTMSQVLYNAVLKIGAAGFENKPIEL